MLRLKSVRWLFLFSMIAIAAVGITVNQSNNSFPTQTATAQTIESDFEYLERANRAFIELVNRAKPAVVQIRTKTVVPVSNPNQFPDWFEYFFDVPRNRRDSEREAPQRRREHGGLGSGIIVSESGYILTNNHVIEDADEITVILPGGSEYDAELIGTDPGENGTDLAVLKIGGKDLPVLNFGDSDALQDGEWVIAIGAPFGLSQSVTRGTVSAQGRSNQLRGRVLYEDFIQTDTPINRGNSGGALVNIRGELVGVNTAILTGNSFQPGNVGVGFAIPSNLAKRVMNQLIGTGEVERGWLGVGIQDLTYELAKDFGLDEPRGALVTIVHDGTPAAKAGVKRGDVILEVDQTPIRNRPHLLTVVAAIDVGKEVGVKVSRRGNEQSLKITLGKRPPPDVLEALTRGKPTSFDADEKAFAGIHVQNLTAELAEKYGHEGETGVVIARIKQGSEAARQRQLRVGSLIQEIDFNEIHNVEDFTKHVESVETGAKVTMYVRYPNGGGSYVTLQNGKVPKEK
ncbi:MAG: Do family serine endopeptidase [Candidatus Poribacteria bacterium]|nr:Do family serine endopeptidase [Candidatus Poribacteria bacterium]